MWWENFSPSYLNEVNKDEFCSVCVCIILCALFRKHYYFDVDMVLFALSLLSSIATMTKTSLTNKRQELHAHTHTASERSNEKEATITQNEDSLLDSVQFNSVRFVPIMFVYILIIIVIVVCILYAVRSLNYIRIFALLFMHCSRNKHRHTSTSWHCRNVTQEKSSVEK